jgi:transposase InsO family protein
VPQETRDAVVNFVKSWSDRTALPERIIVAWLALAPSTFQHWRTRLGKANAHNASQPRDFWLLPQERAAIVAWHDRHPDEGYRSLTYRMLDADSGAVATSPATVYRVLREAGRLCRQAPKTSTKGTGFDQPTAPHQHWHIDITYLNICGTFYYLCSILDGYSRAIVGWKIGESMREPDVELVIHRALEAHPGVKPRIISDNGPQFVANDFKAFVRYIGISHVRTSPYYPQSNGKKERYFQTLKTEAIRRETPLSLDDAERVVERFVGYYNTERRHSAIGYITPQAMLDGRGPTILAERNRRLVAAREQRRLARTPTGQVAA